MQNIEKYRKLTTAVMVKSIKAMGVGQMTS